MQTAALEAINVPALVLAGDRDPVLHAGSQASAFSGDLPGRANGPPRHRAKHMGLIEHHAHFCQNSEPIFQHRVLQTKTRRILNPNF